MPQSVEETLRKSAEQMDTDALRSEYKRIVNKQNEGDGSEVTEIGRKTVANELEKRGHPVQG